MITKRLELTETQKGIYFDCQIDNPVSYNISATILLENVCEKSFENALKLLIGEQEALRSSLEITNGLPVFAIHDWVDFELSKQDISANPGKQEEQVRIIVEEEIGKAFDLTKAPLFRTRLIRLKPDKHLFLICIHHIISDGLSLEIFKKKLLDYYYKLENRQKIILKQDAGFSDFIEQENAKLIKGRYDKQKEFWIKKMQGAEPLALQPDYSARQKDHGIGKEKRFEIPYDMMQNVNNLAMDHEVTTFMFFLAAFGVLMNRYTRNEDIVLSSPFSHRPGMELEETIGCFVYMLPMRFNMENNEHFSTILQQVCKEFIDVYKNIGYPNNLIMRNSQLTPMPGSPSVFDVSFVYDVYEDTEEYGLKTEVMDQDTVTFPGTLMVVLNKMPGKDLIKIQYKPEVFSEESIELMGHRFLKLLEILCANADIKIEDIDLLLENEENRILSDFNSTSFFSYQPQTIIDVFNSRVIKHPDRIALIAGEKTETYASVNAKANQLAAKILAMKKRANESVGVQLERSMDLVISLLAILKAGCAYVPIEPSYPAARKEFIFEDAEISLLITSRNLPCEEGWSVNLIFVDDPDTYTGDDNNPLEAQDPFSLAYIMYTSGSTGKPKGVMIENHSVVNTLLDLERRFPMEEQDIFLLKTAYTFDVSVTELFGWFMGEGALLILEPGGEKNPQLILDEVKKHKVTHINFVPAMFRLFLELFDNESNIQKLNPLKWIFVGGEAVTPDILQKFNSLNTGIKLENVYGPTECTIWASHYPLRGCTDKANIPIGRPLNEIRWYIAGKNDNLQPVGIPGELCLSGVGLARGYLNRDELTKEKFVPNPFYRAGIDPDYYKTMYRTGDLARWLPDGMIEFLGRMDFQVKVRGVRLELGEIENILAEYDGIIQAVVVVKKEAGKPGTLCAYYLSEDEIPAAKLKEHLSATLPAYMIPSFFVHKKELPLNTSGKINRNALIADRDYLEKTSSEYLAPSTDLEHLIASVWEEVLSIPKVGLDDNFFEIGGHSLSLIQVHHRLKKLLNRDFSITTLFQSPTVRLLSENFSKDEEKAIENREMFFDRKEKVIQRDIAVIGMSIRVPGAQNVHEFWNNLKAEKESIYFYSDEELEKLGISWDIINSPNYIKAKGRVDGIDDFDPFFFEYTPGEVRMMSPQLRLLYKGTWEALEDAGYYPGSNSSKIGIFLGGSDDFEWYRKVLFGENGFSDKYQAFTLSTNHFLATRLAYKLDMKGPVYSALTGCSTTLVTPHLACQALILGECDMALAGGVTVELPNEGGYLYEEGMFFSPDGHCRPFDAKARGTVFSNGAGLVVLKRLDEAIRDGDNIYAVIKGSAINNDGKQKVGYVAPSVEGQAEVIQEAYRVAGIDPETVSYIEAHGTGTSLGDPIEVESLTKAFATDKRQFCTLGSLKGNVGHADTAAGIVGLEKVALSLNHRFIPGTVNYEEPNPKIDFKKTPFYVNAHGTEWESNVKGGVLRAGINSFGIGGTNAHMVLEGPPPVEKSSPSEKVNLLNFSAKTPTALVQTSMRILAYLLEHPEINLSDAAWTLQVGRKPFPFRKSLAVDENFYKEPEKIINKLNGVMVNEVKPANRNVYLMFPGQGSQYQGMGRDLYFSSDKSAVSRMFKNHMDQVLDLLKEEERNEFLQLIYGNEDPLKINQTQYTQFALFATSYALAKTVIELGIKPAGMIGHSIGEVTAAAVAGVFELKDAVEIVRFRGQVMQKQEPGTMLAVMAAAQEVEKVLEPDVWLALENTTNGCVVGGSGNAITRFEEKLKSLGINGIRVKTSHAFHTPMMDKAAREFEAMLSSYKINEPDIPIISNVSGMWVGENEMTRPEYWSKHILMPVKFAKSLAEVLKNEDDVFIEVGAGHTLSTFAKQHHSNKDGQQFINLIRHFKETVDDVEYINNKLGQIWCSGIDIDWHYLKGSSVRKRVSLPAYAFDKLHFPIDVRFNMSGSGLQEAAACSLQDVSEYGMPEQITPVDLTNMDELENTVIEAYKAVFGFDTISGSGDFFDLGGDSLKAVSLSAALKRMLSVKVEIKDIFSQTTPEKLAAFISKNHAGQEKDNLIKPVPKADFYPLSSSQKRMYTFYLMDKESLAYNLPSATIIEGELKKERTEAAVRKLVLRHESLRTSFDIVNGQIVQKIGDVKELPIKYSERKYETEDDFDAILKEFIKPFDLNQAPLFRMELVKIGDNRQLLLFDVHHIIADGTAVEILTRDFNTLYYGELEPLKVQYKDYAIWQNSYMKSEPMKKQKEFWLNHLSGELPLLEMPADFERPHISNFKGGRVQFGIENELADRIRELSRKFGATNFMTMLSAWYILLARYSGQEDIIVGTPVSGRTRDEVRETVGMFVNMLAVRNFPDMNKKYNDFFGEVRENTLEALKNQDYQFDTLVDQMNIKRELNRNAIYDASFDYHNMKLFDLEVEGNKFIPCQMPIDSASIDLLLTCNEDNEHRLECYIDYSASLYKKETIERMAEHYKIILNAITENQDVELGKIGMLTDWDKEFIFSQFENTNLPIDQDVLIQEMFEKNAEELPEKVALILSDGREFTYRQLNERANALAWKLIGLGVDKDTAVGIIPQRDENLLTAMLGILKAGGAYVPIDPKFPADRISYMISESKINILICPEKYQNCVDFNGETIDLSNLDCDGSNSMNPPKRGSRDSLAYIVFTSGTTGMPKGVMVKQEGVINLISDHKNRKIFANEDDRIISIATPSFDIFVFESILPLCTGHSIYLADETEHLDSNLLGSKIIQYKVTHLQSPVSRLRAMAENSNFGAALSQLRVIVGGGENYPLSLVKYLKKHTKAALYNMYGPTETTVTATVKDLTDAKSVTVGKAIANTQLFVLSEKGMLQPVGVFGELCISGRGMSRGYLNRPDETESKFVKLNEDANISIYRTGDRARMLADGEIELMGRLDSQVKIRGYRIELGEIEQTAMQNANVSYAAAKAFGSDNGNAQLALFYCAKEENAERNELNEALKEWLQQKLPGYMIPAYIVQLDKMPMLPNGKINRRALVLPDNDQAAENKLVQLPMKRIEKEIINIWKEVLDIQQISVKDNFFDIGGNSFGLMLVNNRLNELLGYTVPLMQLFENPTVEMLAKSFRISEDSPLLLAEEETNTAGGNDDIAVIGVYGRFPGAENPDELWNNLVSGKESIISFSEEELRLSGVSKEEMNDPGYVNAKGYLEGVEYFDAGFFNYSRKEANTMDPQIRLLHMCVWNALEDAGYDPFTYAGKIGLFAGSGSNISWMARFLGKRDNAVNAFEVMTLNDKDFVTTKVSYKLNLKGPSVNVQTACSTSLVAIHQAVKYLQSGEADIAAAGGVSISYPRKEGYLWHEGMIFSKDGHCRPFSDGASGTVSGNGCGVIVLKKLENAIKDNDHIYAVIKGSAINNDGIEKIGFTAPSIPGQRDVIEKALKKARIAPEDIQYVETHGTGTTLGDPIEIEALKQAWRTKKTGYCAIGSVKANLGHLDAAAGVTGCIKAIMVLNNRTIPPMINFKGVNPRIDIENSPFYVNTSAKRLEADVARAAVSAFGIGGTNAHVVLEEAPQIQKSDAASDVNVLLFSAKSEAALVNTSGKVLNYIINHKDLNMSDVAWTLQVGRGNFEYRKAFVVTGKQLDNGNSLKAFINDVGCKVPDGQKMIMFVLPDSGEVCKTVGRSLYKSNNTCGISMKFEGYVKDVLNELQHGERTNVEKMLFNNEKTNLFDQDITIFTINYALAMTLKDSGIHPDVIYGERIGKLSGLAAANAISLSDAVALIRTGCDKSITPDNYSEYRWREAEVPVVSSIDVELEKELESTVVINIGAGSKTVKALLAQAGTIIPVMEKEKVELQDLYEALGAIWCKGCTVNWNAVNAGAKRARIPLPGYVFDKIKFDNDAVLANIFNQTAEEDNKEEVAEGTLDSLEDFSGKLAEIWNEVLGIEKADDSDDFFNLGGESLNAVLMASLIQKKTGINIPVAEIFGNSSFGSITRWLYEHKVEKTGKQDDNQIQVLEKREYYETSSAQKRMFAVSQLIEDSLSYNLASVYCIEGQLNREKLENTFAALVMRHESFRTSFGLVDGQVVQYIADDVPSVVEFVNVEENNVFEEIQNSIKPFDLSKAPLMRVKFLSVSDVKHYVMLDMHHIISDQSSIDILMKEFSLIYAGESLPQNDVRYIDFAAWQNKLFRNGQIEKQISYWTGELAGEIPALDLYTDFQTHKDSSHKGRILHFEMGSENSSQLNRFVKEHRITPYMLMMASLKMLLWKYTAQKDIIIGTAVAGRNHLALNTVVGMFVNLLPIRSRIDETMTVGEYLAYIKNKMVAAFENQDCQFDMLLEKLDIDKGSSNNPLFDIVINYVNMGTDELEIEGLNLTPVLPETIDTKYNIHLTVLEKDGIYDIDIDYSTELFKEETMQLFGRRFVNLVSHIVGHYDSLLSEVSIVSPEDEDWLNNSFNNTKSTAPIEKNVVQIFEDIVRNYGDSIALTWDDEAYSYRQLNSMTNQLAEKIAGKNIVKGDKVAIFTERGPKQIISILAILKCGAVYVPIDYKFPNDRVNFMIHDSEAKLLLTGTQHVDRIEHQIEYLLLDKEDMELDASKDTGVEFCYAPENACGEDEAYIIYTSGSTGMPKGTVLCHKSIIRTVLNTNYVNITPSDKVLQMTNHTFDPSVFDIFGALLNGACLVMVPHEASFEMPMLADIFETKGITVCEMVTAVFNMLVDYKVTALKNVRNMYIGGEAMSLKHTRKAFECLGPEHVVNVYGPTEAAVIASFYPINYIDPEWTSIPIGRPISNTTLYVLDEQGRLVPPNVPGELCIGGCGIAKGYLNRKEMTDSKFVNLSFGNRERVYKTGDRVLMSSQGDIIFLGRIDFQIKLRGFRIELGEIEEKIAVIDGIKDVTVTANKDNTGSLYIAAYYTVSGDGYLYITPEYLRAVLQKQVPDYMVPSRMKRMDSLPLTENGKVNRKALPVIQDENTNIIHDGPRNEAEHLILNAMKSVLDNPGMGIKDDFFQMGGHSIKAIELTQKLRETGVELKVNDIFKFSTAEELAVQPGVVSFMGRKTNRIREEAGEAVKATVGLNERQIDSIAQYIIRSTSMISDTIVLNGINSEFKMSAVQAAHIEAGSNCSGFTMSIEENISEQHLRNILADIIKNHQMMHSAMDEKNAYCWNEFDVDGQNFVLAQSISYTKLDAYDEETQNAIIKKVFADLMYKNYEKGKLPWRLCCLKLNPTKTQLLWCFDHTCFDGMSSEIINRQIVSAIKNSNGIEGCEDRSNIQRYSDYAAILENGPSGLSDEEIVSGFKLDKWNKSNELFMKSLETAEGKEFREVAISVPLDGSAKNIWVYAHELVSNILSGYTAQKDIPMAIVHYGRSYGGTEFYDCVGEFLDIIPVLLDNAGAEKELEGLLDTCRNHSVNFMSLIYDENLAQKYSEVSKNLQKYFLTDKQCFNIALYNFQGYITDNERHMMEHNEYTGDKNESLLAKLFITANYDTDALHITLECTEGLNLNAIETIVKKEGGACTGNKSI